MLLRQQPPSAPTSQAQHPESASTATVKDEASLSEQEDIDSFLYKFHDHIHRRHSGIAIPSISQLYEQLAAKSGTVLDEELPYEDTPDNDRAIDTFSSKGRISWFEACKAASNSISASGNHEGIALDAKHDDGLVLVAHIVAAAPPILSWSLGFMIRTSEGNNYAASCGHTLESAAYTHRKQKTESAASSSTLLVTRSGRLLPVTSIVSSLPLHDIVLYTFPSSHSSSSGGIKSVPVALYPPQIGSEQSLYMVGDDQWKKTKVIGYKDSRGNDAEVDALPGTYDQLTSISMDVHPTPGSSGGPLVSSNGAVTGLVRGSRMAFGDRRSTGFATPAEKIFEMFQLPGLPKKKK